MTFNIINRNKVRAAMILKGENYENICKYLDISITSLSNKMLGKREFKEHEVYLLVKRYSIDILNLDKE